MEGKFHSTSSLTGEPIGAFLFHMGLCLSPAARASIHCGSGSLVYLCLNPSKSQTRSAKLARKPAPYPDNPKTSVVPQSHIPAKNTQHLRITRLNKACVA